MEMSKENSHTVTELSEFSRGSVRVQRELQVKTNTHFGFWWDGALTFSHNPPEQFNSQSLKLRWSSQQNVPDVIWFSQKCPLFLNVMHLTYFFT